MTDYFDNTNVLSPWRMAWLRFRTSPAAIMGAIMVLSVIICAICAPMITTFPDHAGAAINFRARNIPPDSTYWFGTDNVGRDIFSRVIFGFRVSLMLVMGVLLISVPLGGMLGLLAGYFGGVLAGLVNGLTTVFLAVPPLILVVAVGNVVAHNLTNAMIAVALLWWTWHARLVFQVCKSIVTEDYIEAARLSGASHFHILFFEVLPNCISVISVKATLDAAFIILFGATLSFLGLGVQPPTPDLGSMVADGREFLPEYWWSVLAPGLAIFYATLGFNLLGDGLCDMFDVEV